MASMDLVWYFNDLNGCALNPRWEHQLSPGGRPDPQLLCADPRNNPGCTTQPTFINERGACRYFSSTYWYVAGHWNWHIPVTYQGTIYWRDHSVPHFWPPITGWISDDDYNFKLIPPGEVGLTVGNDDGFIVEFDSDETIDNFDHPWWTSFHNAVDNGNPDQMINGKTAIVTGVLGLDCEHGVFAELHPVWAMAIELLNDGYNSLWAVFARNWGNEGGCGSGDMQFDTSSYTFSIPWPKGASGVSIDPGTKFRTNNPQKVTWSRAFHPNKEVLVTFNLPSPDEHAYVDGTILLHWTLDNPPIVFIETSPGTSESESGMSDHEPQVASAQDLGEVEKVILDLTEKMTDQQKDIYLSMLPRKVSSYDNFDARRVEPAVSQAPSMPSVINAPSPQHVENMHQRVQALRAAFGGQIPGIDPDALEKYLDQ